MLLSEYRKDHMYFIKLYDSFINSDEIRWVESQEHGAEIVLMFLRLMMVAKNKKEEKEGETYIKEIDAFPYDEIIEYFNEKIGTNYKNDSKEVIKLMKQHVKEGFIKEDFINVIDKKYKEWNSTDFSKYLRPKTLFGDNFESYVNEPTTTSLMRDEIDFTTYYDDMDII